MNEKMFSFGQEGILAKNTQYFPLPSTSYIANSEFGSLPVSSDFILSPDPIEWI